jgi:hypothetical protein
MKWMFIFALIPFMTFGGAILTDVEVNACFEAVIDVADHAPKQKDVQPISEMDQIQKQLNNCSKYPKSASTVVVLMHDTKKTTRDALPKIIEYYQSCGFKFGVITTSTPRVQHRVNN